MSVNHGHRRFLAMSATGFFVEITAIFEPSDSVGGMQESQAELMQRLRVASVDVQRPRSYPRRKGIDTSWMGSPLTEQATARFERVLFCLAAKVSPICALSFPRGSLEFERRSRFLERLLITTKPSIPAVILRDDATLD